MAIWAATLRGRPTATGTVMVTEGKQGNLFSAVFEGHVEAVGAGSPTEPWILVTTSVIALLRNITRMGGRCVGRAGRDTRAVAGRLNRARSLSRSSAAPPAEAATFDLPRTTPTIVPMNSARLLGSCRQRSQNLNGAGIDEFAGEFAGEAVGVDVSVRRLSAKQNEQNEPPWVLGSRATTRRGSPTTLARGCRACRCGARRDARGRR